MRPDDDDDDKAVSLLFCREEMPANYSDPPHTSKKANETNVVGQGGPTNAVESFMLSQLLAIQQQQQQQQQQSTTNEKDMYNDGEKQEHKQPSQHPFLHKRQRQQQAKVDNNGIHYLGNLQEAKGIALPKVTAARVVSTAPAPPRMRGAVVQLEPSHDDELVVPPVAQPQQTQHYHHTRGRFLRNTAANDTTTTTISTKTTRKPPPQQPPTDTTTTKAPPRQGGVTTEKPLEKNSCISTKNNGYDDNTGTTETEKKKKNKRQREQGMDSATTDDDQSIMDTNDWMDNDNSNGKKTRRIDLLSSTSSSKNDKKNNTKKKGKSSLNSTTDGKDHHHPSGRDNSVEEEDEEKPPGRNVPSRRRRRSTAGVATPSRHVMCDWSSMGLGTRTGSGAWNAILRIQHMQRQRYSLENWSDVDVGGGELGGEFWANGTTATSTTTTAAAPAVREHANQSSSNQSTEAPQLSSMECLHRIQQALHPSIPIILPPPNSFLLSSTLSSLTSQRPEQGQDNTINKTKNSTPENITTVAVGAMTMTSCSSETNSSSDKNEEGGEKIENSIATRVLQGAITTTNQISDNQFRTHTIRHHDDTTDQQTTRDTTRWNPQVTP